MNSTYISVVSTQAQTRTYQPNNTHWPLQRLDSSLVLRADASCSTGNVPSAFMVVCEDWGDVITGGLIGQSDSISITPQPGLYPLSYSNHHV